MALPPIPKLAVPDVDSLIPSTSAALQANQAFLQQQVGALPGIYNPQRQRLAASSARALTDQGFYERAAPTVQGTTADGSTTYGLGGQFEGRAFRDARTQGQAQQARAGLRSSSSGQRAQAQAQQQLVNARQGLERGYADQQFQSLQQQAQQSSELGGQLQQNIGSQADYATQAAQQREAILRDTANQQKQLDYSGALTAEQYRQQEMDRQTAAAQWNASQAEAKRQFDISFLGSQGAAGQEQALARWRSGT